MHHIETAGRKDITCSYTLVIISITIVRLPVRTRCQLGMYRFDQLSPCKPIRNTCAKACANPCAKTKTGLVRQTEVHCITKNSAAEGIKHCHSQGRVFDFTAVLMVYRHSGIPTHWLKRLCDCCAGEREMQCITQR